MKKIILSLLMSLLLLTALSAGGNQDNISPGKPSEPVKIALLNGPSGIGLIQLKADNPFSDSAVTADVQIMGAPKVLLGQMLKEEWDVALLPANMAAILFNKGVGYQAAAVTGMGNLYLLTSEDSIIDSVEDLESLTIHIPGKNTSPDLISQLIAEELGINFSADYSFNPSDLAKALAGGVVKAAILPEPLSTIALKSGKNLKIAFDIQELWAETFEGESNYPMTVMVVKTSFAAAYPKLVYELMIASQESLEWVAANPAEASLLIGDHGFTLPPPIVEMAIPRTNYAFIRGNEMAELMTPYYTRLKGLDPGSIGGAVPSDEFYYRP